MKLLLDKYSILLSLMIIWSMGLLTVVVLRVTDPEIIPVLNMAAATIVGAIVGIPAAVFGFVEFIVRIKHSIKGGN